MKYNRLSPRSDKKKLRDAIGALHLKLLRKERGDRCEICGGPGPVGRFHIIRVAKAPRLEFHPDNILLTHWLNGCQAHYAWHHYGPADHRNRLTLERINELCGVDWEQRLMVIEKMAEKHDTLYLRAKYLSLKTRLEGMS